MNGTAEKLSKAFAVEKRPPVCQEARATVVDCYKQNSQKPLLCSETVKKFSQCVRSSRMVWISSNTYTLFEKSNFSPKIQFRQKKKPNIFNQFFFDNSKLSTAKKSKTTRFSRVFHQKKSTIFSGNQSWIFGQKMKISNSVLSLLKTRLKRISIYKCKRLMEMRK